MALKSREPTESINLNKETEGSCSNRSENSSDIKLDISRTPAIDSPLSTQHQTSRTLFPPSAARPTAVAQLFQTTSRPDQLQCQKNIDQIVKEESLSNMFCAIDDQSGFWPWLEQQQFNWSSRKRESLKKMVKCIIINFRWNQDQDVWVNHTYFCDELFN